MYINDTQFFDDAAALAWEFIIGGYQPAQKWLKDRQGRRLAFKEILHYQRILKVLAETHRIATTLDLPLLTSA